ncbi:hypothetical protein DXB50_06245 [Butyricicoccus sp. OM04-18BH]|nr:hypothetical protein DW923_06700 [Butyricicoccus sp. AM42-5AC]RHV42239.1 hypothetical protein DXB50_06245 [Butyricicoccus sp. OM04-18BH]
MCTVSCCTADADGCCPCCIRQAAKDCIPPCCAARHSRLRKEYRPCAGSAPGLAAKPVLCLGGSLDIYTPPEQHCEPLRRAVERAGGTQFRSVRWPTDHFLSDYRLKTSETVLEFLKS